ncbi:phospholipase A2 inhibitor and Ly6/PLAUR domain-containing protein-like [Rhineura floridana]|uniref:phospholipase A2 inhibitor and Ly6/PLAUR domain-containing protein-like n=1 Tax=Rhineura floridana TaxID=261503 RepID=UPI002AC83FD1|nr:phospholipase A2 inhibitor and Ly6/PLAUR domain-containing protein-like [Rhineura floridana]
MQALFGLFLFSVLLTTGASLECDTCKGTNTCTGTREACTEGQDACAISFIKVSIDGTKFVRKSCTSSEACKVGVAEVTYSQGKYSTESITCCKEDGCTPVDPKFPPRNTKPNGGSCPGCSSNSGNCTVEVVKCTGSDTYCISFVLVPGENVVDKIMKGCISEASCTHLKTYKGAVFGDAPLSNVECTLAEGLSPDKPSASPSPSPSFEFFLLVLLMKLLLLFLRSHISLSQVSGSQSQDVMRDLTLGGLGTSLKCETCMGISTCKGEFRTCPDDNNSCGINFMEHSNGGNKTFFMIKKSCVSTANCMSEPIDLTYGKGQFVRERTFCCRDVPCLIPPLELEDEN